METLHPTEIEIVAGAHRRLTSGGTVMKTPAEACASELDEVIHEADSVPGTVVRARDACNNGDEDRADTLLREFLTDTNYDPDDPDSYYPD